ncbi:hypothetical protein HK097_002761, partial [Rhizophlyctis rosea]
HLRRYPYLPMGYHIHRRFHHRPQLHDDQLMLVVYIHYYLYGWPDSGSGASDHNPSAFYHHHSEFAKEVYLFAGVPHTNHYAARR